MAGKVEGFTVVELVIVLVILAIMSVIALTALTGEKRSYSSLADLNRVQSAVDEARFYAVKTAVPFGIEVSQKSLEVVEGTGSGLSTVKSYSLSNPVSVYVDGSREQPAVVLFNPYGVAFNSSGDLVDTVKVCEGKNCVERVFAQ